MAILITPAQLQDAFDEATLRKFAHFNKLDWLPVWINQKPELPSNISEPPKSGPKALHCVNLLGDRIGYLKSKYADKLKHVSSDRDVENPANPEPGNSLTKMPHPGADFRHVDTGVYTNPEKQSIRKAIGDLKALEHLAKKDGELHKAVVGAINPLDQADGMLETNPKGMQRLKLVFEWALCQVTTLYGEINAALENPNQAQGKDQYNAARARYITLLEDLDDHEPQTKGDPISGVNGYGRALKWAYLLPLIHEGKIKGAKIVAKWNPHISSSGIPIPHG